MRWIVNLDEGVAQQSVNTLVTLLHKVVPRTIVLVGVMSDRLITHTNLPSDVCSEGIRLRCCIADDLSVVEMRAHFIDFFDVIVSCEEMVKARGVRINEYIDLMRRRNIPLYTPIYRRGESVEDSFSRIFTIRQVFPNAIAYIDYEQFDGMELETICYTLAMIRTELANRNRSLVIWNWIDAGIKIEGDKALTSKRMSLLSNIDGQYDDHIRILSKVVSTTLTEV